MLFNIHCHVLPHMDDGASSTAESLEMLQFWKKQGVTALVATPHFYGNKESMGRFLQRREDCYQHLMRSCHQEEIPEIFLGAEVRYFKNITESNEIANLTLGKSKTILLEPPFGKFPNGMITELRTFVSGNDYRLIIAHVDRYLKDNSIEDILSLCDGERIIGQINVSTLLKTFQRKKPLSLLQSGYCGYLGDDAHNMDDRKPEFAEGMNNLLKKGGKKLYLCIEKNHLKLYNTVKYNI